MICAVGTSVYVRRGGGPSKHGRVGGRGADLAFLGHAGVIGGAADAEVGVLELLDTLLADVRHHDLLRLDELVAQQAIHHGLAHDAAPDEGDVLGTLGTQGTGVVGREGADRLRSQLDTCRRSEHPGV